jgi:hypothetical protein
MSKRYCSICFEKFEKLVHLVGFTIEIYYDARTYECQITFYLLAVT